MGVKRSERGFTFVELLVVIVILVLFACLLLPATRGVREPSRRNSCLNNIKQISLALLNYEDRHEVFPLASTTYLNANGDSPSIVGTADDGFSWLFQILPEMENRNFYNLTRDSVEQIGKPGELGKGSQGLKQGPFAPQVVVNPRASGIESLASMQQMEAYFCPSYPGREETKDGIYNGNPAAVGNYVAIPSTHYNRDGAAPGGVDSGELPSFSLFDSYTASGPKPHAGNGVLVFAQRTVEQVTGVDGYPLRSIFQTPANGTKPKGVKLSSIRDGASNTFFFAESREERYSSWISGLSAYVVAADPQGPGSGVEMFLPEGAFNQRPALRWNPEDSEGRTSLNVGSSVKRSGGDKADPALFYAHKFVHASSNGPEASRWYGPSSAHPGIVQHGFADGHSEAISEDIDRNVYLHLVTRAGGEEIDEALR